MSSRLQNLLCLLLLSVVLPAGVNARPLLIEWGQTTPDTRLMRQHVDYWESYLPFDGVVIPVNQERYAGRYGDTCANVMPPQHWPIIWTVFGSEKLDIKDYRHAITDLRATKFEKFKHNFIPLFLCPRMNFALDWFDDSSWETILHNVGILATIAKEGKCEGLWIDVEEYGVNIWNYMALRDAFPKNPTDWDSYKDQAFKRGGQFVRAVNARYPGCSIVFSYGLSMVHHQTSGQPDYQAATAGKDFSKVEYALLAPFMDGMMHAADRHTTFTDGYELSYYHTSKQDFAQARPVVKEACRAYVSDPDLYSRKIQLGFGLWPFHPGMFNPEDFSGNKFTPDGLAEAVRLAMKHTDRYVWVWNESASFWIKGGRAAKPLAADQPAVNTDIFVLAAINGIATPHNSMRSRYYGIPQEYIDAIARGKAGK